MWWIDKKTKADPKCSIRSKRSNEGINPNCPKYPIKLSITGVGIQLIKLDD